MSIFDILDPLAIKWLYQLRVGLSHLYDHKWKHGFRDILSDKCTICNCTESLEHYFLHCVRFTDARRTLFDFILTLNNINFDQFVSNDKIKFLLYGDTSLGVAVNRSVIKTTLSYLKDTERFV